ECKQLATEKKWPDLQGCATRLEKLDPRAGKELKDRAFDEQSNEIKLGKLNDEIGAGNVIKAKKLFDSIGDDSVYKTSARNKYEGLENRLSDDARKTARGYASHHKCDELDKYIQQLQDSEGATVASPAKSVH